MKKRAAKWIANSLASNLVWVLISGSLGAVASAVLKAMGAFSNPYGLVAIGLLVAAICVVVIQKVQQRRRTRPEIDDDLALMIYNAQREERERVAKRIAEEEVRREMKRLK